MRLHWCCMAPGGEVPTNLSHITRRLRPLLPRLLLLITAIDRMYGNDRRLCYKSSGSHAEKEAVFAQKSFGSPMYHFWQSLCLSPIFCTTPGPPEVQPRPWRAPASHHLIPRQRPPLSFTLPYAHPNTPFLWLAGMTLSPGSFTPVLQLQKL